jgi:hypothetical protein
MAPQEIEKVVLVIDKLIAAEKRSYATTVFK